MIQYLPLWSDVIVGGSPHKNNTAGEISIRLEKRVFGHTKLRRKDEYHLNLINMKMDLNHFFIVRLADQFAKREIKLIQSTWGRKGYKKSATLKNERDLIDIFKIVRPFLIKTYKIKSGAATAAWINDNIQDYLFDLVETDFNVSDNMMVNIIKEREIGTSNKTKRKIELLKSFFMKIISRHTLVPDMMH